MADFHQPRVLGKTGLVMGRMGLGSSYNAPAAAYEEAFDRGCNYFYWGTMRRPSMRDAIRHLCARGLRDRLVVVIQLYTRFPFYAEWSFARALRALRLDHADVCLLGMHQSVPSRALRDRIFRMREQGMFRLLAVSGHNRLKLPEIFHETPADILHVRYNAAHRGAEAEVFPHLPVNDAERPGLVSFTATSWRQLLNPKRLPPGEKMPRGRDCYRFVLSHPSVDLCLAGPRSLEEMREALAALDDGPLNQEELARMRRIGDFVHGHVREGLPLRQG